MAVSGRTIPDLQPNEIAIYEIAIYYSDMRYIIIMRIQSWLVVVSFMEFTPFHESTWTDECLQQVVALHRWRMHRNSGGWDVWNLWASIIHRTKPVLEWTSLWQLWHGQFRLRATQEAHVGSVNKSLGCVILLGLAPKLSELPWWLQPFHGNPQPTHFNQDFSCIGLFVFGCTRWCWFD